MIGISEANDVKMTSINDNLEFKNTEDNSLLSEDKNHQVVEKEKEEVVAPIIKIDEVDCKSELNSTEVDKNINVETLSVDNEKCDRKTPESEKEDDHHTKGILKYQRTYSNKHVDFNMDLEFVPFDETKDYTIEIQIVEQMPKKIVSYAALFAQQKKEEEEKEKQRLEEEKQRLEEEKQKRKHKTKRKQHGEKKVRKPGEEDNNDELTERNEQSTKDSVEVLIKTEDLDELNDDEEPYNENSYISDCEHEPSDSEFISAHTSFEENESKTNSGVNRNTESMESLTLQSSEFHNADKELEGQNNHVTNVEESQMKQNNNIREQNTCRNLSVIPKMHMKDCDIIQNSLVNFLEIKVPDRTLRSHSLTDLEVPKKLSYTVIQNLSPEIELIMPNTAGNWTKNVDNLLPNK